MPLLLYIMDQMEIRMFSIWMFVSFFSAIHLHTSKMICLSFYFISWESFFSIFSSDWEALYRLLLGYGNVDSTII